MIVVLLMLIPAAAPVVVTPPPPVVGRRTVLYIYQNPSPRRNGVKSMSTISCCDTVADRDIRIIFGAHAVKVAI
jgi:hypothetical protein